MDTSIKPFKISIPSEDLETLHQKLHLTRLPPTTTLNWHEENNLTPSNLQTILTHWVETYSWRAEESRINSLLPQYTTTVRIEDGPGAGQGNAGLELTLHFVHSRCSTTRKTALLFLHGWPGSFLEISKGVKGLNEAGFDVVAPSLPGYGFSTYPPNRGFDHRGHARVLDEVMTRLGYGEYVVQGGDWGSSIARTLGLMFPSRVRGVHVNMLATPQFDSVPSSGLTAHEAAVLDREQNYFLAANSGYTRIQAQRPITLGYAMHDSPLGLLAYIADKLITWSDAYPWTPTELITWTLMHYFPGPTTGFVMYHENNPSPLNTKGSGLDGYMDTPLGVSSFPKELIMKPRAWAEKVANVVLYKEHDAGGHFAMWEVPDALVGDVVEFVAKLQK